MQDIKTTKILGIDISAESFAGNLETVASFLNDADSPNPSCRMIFTPNPEVVVHAGKDEEYFKILNSGDLVVADGVGIIIASVFNEIRIKQRTPGIDLILALFDKMRDSGIKVYFLGGKPEIAAAAALAVIEKFPGIISVGVSDGYFDKKKERIILKDLREQKPDIVLVGLGFPRQEKWIYENRNRIAAKIAIGCGGSLDVLAGSVKRAPKLFRVLGLEWFFRLISQPKRFFRMLKLPVFLIRVVIEKITRH